MSGEYAVGGEGYWFFKVMLEDSLMGEWEAVHHPHMEFERFSLQAGKPYKIEVEYQ